MSMKQKIGKIKKIISMFLVMALVFQVIPHTMPNYKVYAKTNSKNNAAMKQYKALLTDSKKAKEVLAHCVIQVDSKCKFALIDLNKDGIKEMALTSDDGYHLYIVGYVNGKVKLIECGFAGEQKYYTNKHIYYSLTSHTGDYTASYYKFNGVKMKLIAEKQGSMNVNLKTGKAKPDPMTASYAPYEYTVKGKKVSKKKYKAYVKKLLKGAKNEKLKWHKNTKTNRSKYIIVKSSTKAVKPSMKKVLNLYKAKKFSAAKKMAKQLPKKASEKCVKNMSSKMKASYLKKVKKYQRYSKWNKNNGFENAETYIEAYYLTDFDNDGKAELIIKCSDGSQCGTKVLAYKYKNGKTKKLCTIVSEWARGFQAYAYPGHKGIVFTESFPNADYMALCVYDKSKKTKCKWTAMPFPEDKFVNPVVPYELDDHVPANSEDISYDALK